MPGDALAVARVREAWGVGGWLRLDPFNVPEESVLLKVRRAWLRPPAPSVRSPAVAPVQGRSLHVVGAGAQALVRAVRFTRCRVHGDALVAKPLGCDDRGAAEALRGLEVWVSRADFPRPDPGQYYQVDLIGLEVFTPQGERLGRVERFDEFGADPVMRVRDAQRERMIPFVDALVREVDLAQGRLVVDWDVDF